MEPVQRIPRYTLLFRTMLKHMDLNDPQRAKIIEADEIASKIAQAETDEQTKRAATFYCLSASIDGFPADLFSNSRKFIDCIDVEDRIGEFPTTASSTAGAPTILHCTLFLFDDKLLIVKRPNGDKGGRALSGLDILEKLTKSGGIPTGKKKSGMSAKGVVDLADVVVSDPGGPGTFHQFSACHMAQGPAIRYQHVPGVSASRPKRKVVGAAISVALRCNTTRAC